MEYMLMFHESAATLDARNDPELAPAYWGAWMHYVGALEASGVVKAGRGLQLPHTSTTVKLDGGRRVVQDGPFADTREFLGGFFVIDVPSLDVALDWAAQAPCAADGGATEVRPVLPPPQG
jgi:hypothetical protein